MDYANADYAGGASVLAEFVRSLDDFPDTTSIRPSHDHMGATISDCILQAGLNYRTVVAPRLRRLRREWPEAATTSGFLAVLVELGGCRLLHWQDAEKPRRVLDLTRLLVERRVETETELRRWVLEPENEAALRAIKGVGPKTVDYLKTLVGLPCVAVDRHMRTFVRAAGLPFARYDDVRKVVELAAGKLLVNPNALDCAIWSYVASFRASAYATA
jgi:3-methyladenine DNA glycosylase/8-oxoguanine DNA glycosylase